MKRDLFYCMSCKDKFHDKQELDVLQIIMDGTSAKGGPNHEIKIHLKTWFTSLYNFALSLSTKNILQKNEVFYLLLISEKSFTLRITLINNYLP